MHPLQATPAKRPQFLAHATALQAQGMGSYWVTALGILIHQLCTSFSDVQPS